MRPNTLQPALLLSQIRPENINLREGEHRLVLCPDCTRWRPIQRRMIKPHHLDRSERGGRAPKCPSSARLITFDITVAQWREALMTAESTAAGIRAKRQFHKPERPKPTPVFKLGAAPEPQTAAYDRARRAAALHREHCTDCRTGRRCPIVRVLDGRLERLRTGVSAVTTANDDARGAVHVHLTHCAACRAGQPCPIDHALVERLKWTAESRNRAELNREQRVPERQQTTQLARRRAEEWQRTEPAVTSTDHARHTSRCTDCRTGTSCRTGKTLTKRLMTRTQEAREHQAQGQ